MQRIPQRIPETASSNNNEYWNSIDQALGEYKKRTRRQFLTAAGALCGGTAVLLGGLAVYNQPGLLSLGPKSSNCTTASSTGSSSSPSCSSLPSKSAGCSLRKEP